MVNFWLNDYDWRSREKYLNSLPQFTTQVNGLQIHFLHVKPKPSPKHKVLPLLLVHGWPGSVREFYEMIPMLTTPRPDQDFVFEVIAPSMPGYGFSQVLLRHVLLTSFDCFCKKKYSNILIFPRRLQNLECPAPK